MSPQSHAEGMEVRITPASTSGQLSKLSMGIFATVWPSWYFAGIAAHFDVKWIVCLEEDGWNFCAPAVHGSSTPLYSVDSVPSAGLPAVHVCGLNGLMSHHVRYVLPKIRGCGLIASDSRLRGVGDTYQYARILLSHASCGGVSDLNVIGHFYSSFPKLVAHMRSCRFPTYPNTPVEGILSRTVSSSLKGLMPSSVQVSTTTVLPVKRRRNTYYCRGLYPVRLPLLHPGPWIVSPCVFPPNPWVVRRLTPLELGEVFDLPTTYVQKLEGSHHLGALLHRIHHPIKPLSVMLQHLFYYSVEPPQSTVPPAVPDSSRPAPSSQQGASSSSPSPPGSSPGSLETSSPVGDPGGGASFSDAVSPSGNDEDRQAVAVKHDNAAVPVHVWREQLSRILNTTIPPEIWENGVNPLRAKLMCMWRCGLLRDYLMWVKNQYPTVGKDLRWCTGRYNWDTGASTRPPLTFPIVKWNKQSSSYNWTNGGQARYRDNLTVCIELMGKDWVVARICIRKAAEASWWKWDNGSKLFFWRWPEKYRKDSRDGPRCWVDKSLLPTGTKPQRPPSNPHMKDKIREKLADVMWKEYMIDEFVRSLTSFFDVPKGLFDIRIVYNGTESGLNAAVWAPWFPLPTIRTHLRSVESGTRMADLDVGEMFLNFDMDEAIQPYAGVDLTLYFPELVTETRKTVWRRWAKLMMGFRPSPYLTTRHLLRARKVLLGDKDDENNPFRWDHAELNYPGLDTYNPLRPRVYKVRKDGLIAGELHKYIDDLRLTNCNETESWQALMRIATMLNYLGMQNAARKLREGGLKPGAWTGSIIYTSDGTVVVLVSQVRWDKTKSIILRLTEQLKEGKGWFELKPLLSDRGFLLYIAQTYPAANPYLKGLHLTIDGWRPFRDNEGWKVKMDAGVDLLLHRRSVEGSDESKSEEEELEDRVKHVEEFVEVACDEIKSKSSESSKGDIPLKVKAVPRLKNDLEALRELFKGDSPTHRQVRAKSCNLVKFGFADASGSGYGSAIAKLKGKPSIRYGKWGIFFSSGKTSSNFRELRNIVDAVEADYEAGLLHGFELFIFTDNMVSEQAYYKGNSTSKELFKLILRLRKIEMDGKMIIHVIHVSGKRMIACGVDGLSRADTSGGLAAGVDMKHYVPLHEDAIQRSSGLLSWIHKWWPDKKFGKLKILNENDWFIQDEAHGCCLWHPAPAGGEAATEELANWIHHSPDERIHVVVIPLVWTSTWRRQLLKAMDLFCVLPNCFEFWNDTTHYEPLGIGIFIPYLNRKPWRVKHHPIVAELERKLRRGRFGACYSSWCADCYRPNEAVPFPKVIPIDEEGVCLPCKEDDLFDVARKGDTLMTPFQCDLCHFRNIKSRNPVAGNARDERALVMIRRANLDAFWARTTSTVRSNLSDFRQFLKHSRSLWGDVHGLPPRGPFALSDEFGMAIACATLSRSLDKGKNARYIQFNTARRIRATFSNYWNASLHTLDTSVLQGGQAKVMLTECPVYHYWYTRMMKGMHERMGDLVVQDLAISRELQKALMELVEEKLRMDRGNYSRWVEIGTYLMLIWLAALRGNEAMMLSLDGCRRMMETSEPAQREGERFGIAVLQGKFKTSTGYTNYMMYLSSETKTPFRTTFRGWLKRLLRVREREGRTTGWMFAREDGSQLEMSHYEVDILRLIVEIQENTDHIIPKDLDVFDKYGVFRSWRRGATSVARNEGLSKADIELNNWWQKAEESRGKHVASDMLANYTEDLLVIDGKQRFSAAL